MMTITNSFVRQELGESKVNNHNYEAKKIVTKKNIEENDTLTLPEIKAHLDDILKETQIKYTLDEQENGFIIKVMDKKTDKLIKEIPSHDIQVLRKHFRSHMGVLFNELI